MFKFLITGLLVYFVYRFFLAPPVIDRAADNQRVDDRERTSQADYEDDYIDYEEVE